MKEEAKMMTQGFPKTDGKNSAPGPVLARSLDSILGKLWTKTDGWKLVLALALYLLTALADKMAWVSPEAIAMAYGGIKDLFGVAVLHKGLKGVQAARAPKA